jgi:hypothetical protein
MATINPRAALAAHAGKERLAASGPVHRPDRKPHLDALASLDKPR